MLKHLKNIQFFILKNQKQNKNNKILKINKDKCQNVTWTCLLKSEIQIKYNTRNFLFSFLLYYIMDLSIASSIPSTAVYNSSNSLQHQLVLRGNTDQKKACIFLFSISCFNLSLFQFFYRSCN